MASHRTAARGRARGSVPEAEPDYSITAAEAPHSEGLDHRMKRYAFHMALRVACLLVAVATEGWIRWTAVVGVVVLPWMAVVLANGNDRAEVRDASYYLGTHHPQLGSGPARQQAPTEEAAEEAAEQGKRSRKHRATGEDPTAPSESSPRLPSSTPGPPDRSSSAAAHQDPAGEVLDGEFFPGHRSTGRDQEGQG